MESRDWPSILTLVEGLWDLPEEERAARLEEVFASEPELREPVERLLRADADPPAFLKAAGGLEFAADVDGAAPRRLGPYSILEELGRGGMGTVYVAERADGRFERRVALKALPSALHSGVARDRFHRETQLLARLEHPNIARLYDAGVDEGAPYLVMELVDGTRIDDYCDAEGMGVKERLRTFEGVCDAVQHAHQNLVIHRDLKPSNILVSQVGVVKLLDFGIAHLQQDESGGDALSGVSAMTPAYASPEQTAGGPVTVTTDVYSLGVILHELLTGRRPLGASEDGSDVSGWTETDAPVHGTSGNWDEAPAHVRGDLGFVLERALARDPEHRYPSVQALLDDLRRLRSFEPLAARPGTRWYRTERFVRRNRVAVLAAVALGVTISGGTGAALWQGRVAAVERDVARREAARAEEAAVFLRSVFTASAPGQAPTDVDVLARDLLDFGARRIETELVGDPLLRADVMNLLGGVYSGLAEEDVAEQMLTQAADQYRTLLDAQHPEAIDALLDLADFNAVRYSRRPEHETAATIVYREVVEATRENPTLQRQRSAALVGLGGTFLQFVDGEVTEDEARVVLDEGLALAREIDDLDLIGYAAYYRGWLEMSYGDAIEAERLLLTGLRARTARWGETSPATLTIVNQIGWLYESLGRYEEAAEYFERSMEARRRIYGDRHPRLMSSLNGLGVVRLGQARYTDAERLLSESIVLGGAVTSDSTHASTYAWLGRAFAGQGRATEAIGAFQRAVDVSNARQRPRTLNDYAVFLRSEGRLEEAEVVLRQAIEAYVAIQGSEHPYTAVTRSNLGTVLLQLGRHIEAGSVLESAVASMERVWSPDHPSIGGALVDLGWVRLLEGSLDEANRLLTRAHEITTNSYAQDHWRVGVAKLYLGVSFRTLQQVQDAERALLASHAILEPQRAVRTDDWYWVNTHLAQLYDGLGRGADAQRFRSELTTGGG